MMLWQDVRFAARLLVKDRWFTLAAATALALGIGANAAVFTFVNAVLLRGLPFDNPDKIISLGVMNARGQRNGGLVSGIWRLARANADHGAAGGDGRRQHQCERRG